jgi:hypothetical protein
MLDGGGPVWAICGDSRAVLGECPAGLFDCVVCDPPYPEVDRDYGRWTEAEWFALMDVVVPECRRVLRPTGSAVFVIQPNSERVGRMRTWWLRFMLDWAERWGLVQDAWWWNFACLPVGGAPAAGLLRPSVKACVWLGPPDCYRAQGAVLWAESARSAGERQYHRARVAVAGPSGQSVDKAACYAAAVRRGGVTPPNLIPVPNTQAGRHGAETPLDLVRWWVRYLCPPGGLVLDPFYGSGTTGEAVVREGGGRRCVGVERVPEYAAAARERVAAALSKVG